MTKFRMMLPMLAFVFAVFGAVAGDLFSPIVAYYKLSATVCSTAQVTEQSDCKLSNDPQFPLCTILVGSTHQQAFQNSNCTGILRNVPQQ
jgi:hypothetical protein